MAKIEVIADSTKGPFTIKINDTVVDFVEDYELYQGSDGAHRVRLTILTTDFILKKAETNNERK